MTMHMHARHRGFLIMDVIGGLLILSVLVAVLATAVFQQQKAVRRLDDSLAAVAIAERALADLQTGQAPQAEDPQSTVIQVHPIKGVQAPPGRVWVRVAVSYRTGGTELTGIAPASAAEVRR